MSTFAEYTKKKKKKDVDVSELAKKHSSFRGYTEEVLGVELAPIGSPVKTTVDIAPVKPTVNAPSSKPADKITSLMSVYGNKDFSSKSGYVSTKSEGIWEKLGSKYGMNYNDLQYEYINNQNDIRKEIDSKAVSWGSDTGKTSSSYKEKALDYMTEDEVAVYNYYYQTEGKDKAQEFLDALAETLNARKAGKDFESIEGKTAREILYGTVAGAEQFKQGVKGFGSMITGKDDYIPQTSTQILTGKIREDLADDGTKVFGNSLGQVVHDALSTGTNMLPSVMTGGVAGTILMGATAAGNAYQQDLNEFGDKEKARIYATTIGALEGTLQHFMGGIGQLGGTSAAISNAVSGVKNGALRFALEYGGKIGSEALEEGLQEVLDPVVKNWTHGTEESVDWENVAYSALLGGLMGGVFGATEVSSTHLNANENAVVDKVYNDTIAEREADGKKLSQKEKAKIYDETITKLEKGYIDIDTIESVIGGDTYHNYKAEVDKEAMQEADYKRQLEALKDQANTLGNAQKYQEIETKLNELKNNSKTTEIKKQLSEEVSKIVQGTKLSESYNEIARRGQDLEVDVESYKNDHAKQTAQNFKDFGVNNTNATHDYLDLVTKVAEDRGHTFKFMTTKQLEESIANGNPYNITEDAGKVEAFVSGSTKEIVINMDANKSLTSLVGHEVMHTLEKANSYSDAQNALFEYAKTKGEYEDRWASIQRRYSKLTEEQQMQELTSDLVGDYVFGDTDFIRNLSTENPNIFKKIYNEIKYLWKMATAGSKEARELERVKREFEKIWAEAYNADLESGNISEAEEVSDAEVNSILEQNGVQPVHRQGGDVGLDKFGFNDDGSVKYSIADSDGNQLTKEQQEYFKNSKVRDADGNLMVVYHGSKDYGFTVFDTAKSDDNMSLFFTNDANMANSYVNDKSKLYKTYLNLENPFVVDAKGHRWNQIRLGENNDPITGKVERFVDLAMRYDVEIDFSLVSENLGSMTDSVEYMLQEEAENLDDGEKSLYSDAEKEELRQLASDIDEAYENWDEEAHLDEDGEPTSLRLHLLDHKLSTKYNTRQIAKIAKEKGHDGVIIENVYDNGKFTSDTGIHGFGNVYIAFDSNQVKNVDNTAPTSDADIRYSLSEEVENVSDRLSMSEWKQVKTAVADYTKRNYHYEKSATGDIIIPINNKLVYTDANFDSPGIRKVIEFDSEYEDEIDAARRLIYEAEKSESGISDAYEIIEDIIGYEIIHEYMQKNSSNDKRYDRRTGRGKSQSDSYHANFLQERIRRANEIISSVNQENNVEPSSEDDGFFDGKTRIADDYYTSKEYGNHIYAKDVALAPTEESLMNSGKSLTMGEKSLPIRSDYAPLTEDEANVRDDRQIDDHYFLDDMPAETEEEYNGSYADHMKPSDPFYEKDIWEVGRNRKQKAYMYENPEVKPFFQQEARYMLGELDNSQKGEKFYNDQLYYDTNGEMGFFGTKRFTSEDIAYLLDTFNYTYKDIAKGLNAIIEDNGKENNAISKRIEFLLDERLRTGYTDFWFGDKIPPNQDYINLLNEKEITQYNDESWNNWLRGLSDDDVAYLSNTREDVVPPQEYMSAEPDIAPVKSEAPLYEENNGQVSMFEESETPKTVTRSGLHSAIINNIKQTFSRKGFDFDDVLKKAKNLSTFSTVDNIPQRVMEKALGYKQGQVLSDLTVNKVAQNESEGTKWLNSFTDRKNGLLAQISKQYKIKAGSKESAAAQMYAEGFYVNDNNEIIKYGDAELAKDFPNQKVRDNIKALAKDERIRQIYDETLKSINESRSRNAYPEIPRLDNYFLHFRAMDDTFSRLGLPFNPNDIRAKDLPTDLNGVTADLKPGQPYFASQMHRTGKRTSFDLLGGLERYLTSAKNQIYHIDDIQTLRALRNYIADTYGQANGLGNLDTLSEEEAQQRIEQVYGSHLSTFAKFLNEEANILAGKTALIDRGLEGIIGRRGITFLDTVNKQVGSNMVGFNVSSSLTNVLPVVQTFAKTNKADFVKAFSQTVSNKISSLYGKNDGFAEQSPVMIRRKGADRFYRTPFQKVGDTGYILMGAVDNFTTEIIARTKYNELTRKGMDSQKAHYETDKWVSRLMGDRSLGQMPQLYNSKMLGLITKFQLEVRNQLDSQFYDTIQEAKVSSEHIQNGLARNAKTAAKVASTFAQLAVAQHLFGAAFESIAGYNPAFDIIEVLLKTIGYDDDEESEDTVLDNVEQGFLMLLEDLPYTSTLTGGRIPISAALPVEELITGKDEYGNDKSRLETLGEIAPYYALPTGYGQIKKSVQGLNMFDDDLPVSGSYTDSGSLRFPVEDTPKNRLQAGLFGQYASDVARDYFDNERNPLKEKQIQEFKELDIPIRDYWDYREGLSKQETLEDKFEYIADLDVSVEQKNIMINNVVDRKEKVDMSNYDDFANYEEFDFYIKNTEKYNFLQDNGVSYSEYKADKDMKDEYDDIYSWYKKYPEKVTLSKTITSNVIEYRRLKKELDNFKGEGAIDRKKAYIFNELDLDYGQKAILFRTLSSSDKNKDKYNNDIVEYLNSRDDISYEEMVIILEELDMKILPDGSVDW